MKENIVENTRVIRERRPRSPRLTISTTSEIIDQAIPEDSGHCVWADAIREAYPGAQRISVDLATMRFSDPRKGCRYTYLTPRTVQVDLVNFDQGVKSEPKSVRLSGGIVTKVNPRGAGKPTSVPSKAQIAQRLSALEKGNVPDRLGGKTPPLGAFSNVGGQRREFGLRGLGLVPK